MSLLYGESSKALCRLQLEIIRTSSDESIFVWDCPSEALDANMGLFTEKVGKILQLESVHW
jgi:hypothetical protein